MILTVKMEGTLKAAAVLSLLVKVCTISCHGWGQNNVMVFLQTCTDPLHILPGSPSETFPTTFDDTYDVSNTEVEEDVVVIEEGFVAVNEEVDIGVKQEEIPEDINFPDINAVPDEVSHCVHVCY
jgi:L-alanine-DL-glutamate epimerase-like enolase superfamily enzyme